MRVPIQIARRELAGGLRGFWIYIACLALGAAAIAAAGSVTEVYKRGLAGEARTLLGGDILLATNQRELDQEELAFLAEFGRGVDTAGLDVMGAAGELRRQVDLRAVGNGFPLVGDIELGGDDIDLSDALAFRDGRWGTVVTQSFLDAFGVDIGDTVDIGPLRAVVRARIDRLPDRLGTPGGFGPEAIVGIEPMREVGRLNTGQLFQGARRLILDEGHTFETVETRFAERFPESSVRLREPEDAVNGLRRMLEILNTFMTIIGVAALVAGGLGVAQATQSFLETRMGSIAALKALGASSGVLRSAYLLQLAALAVFGAVIGLMIGAATPYALALFADVPLPQVLGIYALPLLKALGLSLLAAAVFALPALGRARATPPAALFRALVDSDRPGTPWLERSWSGLAAIGLAILAIGSSEHKMMTAALLGGAVLAWIIFLGIAQLIRMAARQVAKGAKGYWRLTLSNLGGPGSLAPTIVPALGLGLALLCLVVAVQANVLRQIGDTAPANAPSLIFNQIPHTGFAQFDQVLAEQGVDTADAETFRRAPFLLVRLIEIDGSPIDAETVGPSARWLTRRETQVTYLAEQPPEAVLTAGEWWPPEHSGPLLVSVEDNVARGLDVGVGDELTFRVFGNRVTARVASLRTNNGALFGIGANTSFVFSPGGLEGAQPYHVAIARTSVSDETAIINALGSALPEVVVFQVRPALESAQALLADVAVAINGAAGVVILAGLLVLLGAFAAIARKRRAEAALLKTFGASRGEILRLYAGEFGLAGVVAALLGALIGVAAAYPVVVEQIEASWHWPYGPILLIMASAALVAGIGGAVVGTVTLARPPAEILRTQ